MELRVMRAANGDARRALSAGGAGSSDDDLARLVAEITSAAEAVDQSRSRWLCPEPLPDVVDARRLDTGRSGDGVPYALVDLPDRQRQQIRWWEPGRSGSLLIHGTDGAGTSSLVESLAVGAAERYSADDLHLYVIDSGARAPHGALAPLSALPHTGAVVRFDDLARVQQLVRVVVAEIIDRTASIESARRRALPSVSTHETLLPHIVVVIDDVGALHHSLRTAAAPEHVSADIVRVARDGPAVGVCVVVAAKRPDDVPAALAAHIPSRLVMRLADTADYASFGLRPVDIPAFVPGRALDPTERAELQVVRPAASLADAVAALAATPARFRPPVVPDPQ
jgi:S-DNA-T family DNA segregation ATPase FtsK/SpoIIIE